MDLLNEMTQHLLGDLEVRDDPVFERPDRLDRAGGAAEHALSLDSHRMNLAGARVHRHDAGLGEHDAATAHVDESGRGTEIDRHVAAAESCQIREEPHVYGDDAGAKRSGG